METLLPDTFTDLDPFVEEWALPTETQRYAKRCNTAMEDIQAFYDAIFPRSAEILDFLDGYSLDDLPEECLTLLHLVYSLVCISIPVEAWRQPRVPDTGASEIICLAEPIP